MCAMEWLILALAAALTTSESGKDFTVKVVCYSAFLALVAIFV